MTRDGAIPFKLFELLSVELDGVLGLDRLNASQANLQAQAIAVSDEPKARRLVAQMEREANR